MPPKSSRQGLPAQAAREVGRRVEVGDDGAARLEDRVELGQQAAGPGAGGEDEAVGGEAVAVGEVHGARVGVERRDGGLLEEIHVALAQQGARSARMRSIRSTPPVAV